MPRNYGNVMAAGAASKQFGKQSHKGQGGKNLGPSASRKPNPAPSIRSTGQQVKGPDKGAGSS